MLKIVRSGFSSSARDNMLLEIKRCVEEKKKTYLIVPEQETVIYESESAKLLPAYAPLYFEVTNFTRLANSTFRALGGVCGEYCDRGRSALIMWRTLTELSPMLKMTEGQREISAGLVESALRALSEIQGLGISADELYASADNERIKADKRLSDKLSDLAKIYTMYKSLLGERFSDSGDDCEMMIRRISENEDFLRDKCFFVEGFTSFMQPQTRLIAHLAARCDLTLYLTVPKVAKDNFEYTEIRDTTEKLLRAANKLGASVKLVDSTERKQKKSEALSLLCELLWTKSHSFGKLSLQNSEELRVFEASTPFDECEFIASDIRRRVIAGDSFSDFAIIARRSQKYLGILDTALKRADIPSFISYKKDADSYEIIKLIYTAYAIIRSAFVKENVITYAKCGLSGISHRECDELELYVDTWKINGSRFTDETVWNMNPDGYTNRRADDADERLLRINATKEKLIAPLMRFKENATAAKTVRESAEALLDFLLTLDAEGGLKKRAELLKSLGESDFAEENLRLWKLICDSLDTLVDLMGDTETTLDGFLGQLKILFANANIGKIPAHLDEVTVGDADMIRLKEKKHVYLIGLNSGEFPEAASDGAYFTDKDKESLSLAGIAIDPNLQIKEARELYMIQRALSYASDTVTLSYSASSNRYKATTPSDVIDNVLNLVDGLTVTKISALSATDRLYSATGALEDSISQYDKCYPSITNALQRSGYERELRTRESDITNADMRLTLPVKNTKYLSLSQSKIDTFVSCPLKYFCKYTVALSPERVAEFDSAGIGSFIHAILENFFKMLEESGKGAGELTPEERETLTRRAAERYIRELGESLNDKSKRTEIKLERLCRAALPVVEGLCEEFSVSRFTPKFFELSISGEGDDSPSPIKMKTESGISVVVRGIIDRVDTLERDGDVFVRIVDYKTGQKTFSPEDLAEGKNLQMFIYLRSIVESENEGFKSRIGVSEDGKMIPAGVLYLKTFIGDKTVSTPNDELALTEIKNAQEREGMLLDNEEIISAMGLKYTPLYSSKTPNSIPEAKRNLLYDESGWNELKKTVEESVKSVAEQIAAGYAAAAPDSDEQTSSCDYCDYKPICRRVKIGKRRR